MLWTWSRHQAREYSKVKAMNDPGLRESKGKLSDLQAKISRHHPSNIFPPPGRIKMEFGCKEFSA